MAHRNTNCRKPAKHRIECRIIRGSNAELTVNTEVKDSVKCGITETKLG